MAKYQSQLDGPQMDTALGALYRTNSINGVLKNDGSGNYTAIPIDSTPTTGSANLVTSGGVKSAVNVVKMVCTNDGSGHITFTVGGV